MKMMFGRWAASGVGRPPSRTRANVIKLRSRMDGEIGPFSHECPGSITVSRIRRPPVLFVHSLDYRGEKEVLIKVGLVGFAGSGKTTVFNTLTGLSVPTG